jgi:hypothetical protein
MEKYRIDRHVYHIQEGYKGAIKVYENNRKLYIKISEIVRLTEHDAWNDAEQMKIELMEENGLCKK